MRMKATALRFALAAAGTALGALLLDGAASAQDTIKIGVTQPLTGAFAASGNYVAQGAKLAEEAINAAGGVLGKKIELIVEDNKSNPTEAAATAEKLIVKDKVPVMLGAWGSGLTLAIMPKLEEYKVPMVVETSSSAKIKASGGDTVFVTTAVEQITLILKQAKDQQLGARIITTGGSNSPDQLIQQAGEAANGSLHLVFFTPWFTDAVKNPDVANKFV